MKETDEMYDKVIGVLRNSKPQPWSTEDITNQALRRIKENEQRSRWIYSIPDILFGWVYIGWVRKSFISLSVFLVAFFVWQQSIILKRINSLGVPSEVNVSDYRLNTGEIERSLMLYKLSGKRVPAQLITIPESQMNQLLDSVNALQSRYRDLIKIINSNPEIRKAIELKSKDQNSKIY
jgi:hypothetical protein